MKRLVSIFAITLAACACAPAGAQAAFGVYDFDVSFTTAEGNPAVQAGSHPFALTTALGTNFSGTEQEGRLRGLFLEHVPGLLSDATAYPRCTAEEFIELEEGVNGCPLETAVGIAASSYGEPGEWITAPIFNLVPPPGALMRLGFRAADAVNLFADIGVLPEPPYSGFAELWDVSEAIALFGLKLQLWGVPADPAHDALRGRCGVYTASHPPGDIAGFAFTGGSGESCPVGTLARPLLTLPASCQGPQESFYEAISWEGGEDWGGALTHDGAGEPMGFGGCSLLGFEPLADVEVTTEAAKSPSGLDVSLQMQDEGLTNGAGIAQSQIRGLELALPEGMAVDPALTGAVGACSEADLAEEGPEAAIGDGCPAASKLGTLEVESPLVAEPIEGAVYRATPHANLADDSALAVYLVARDDSRGILVVQPVEVEVDSQTGQLTGIAEDVPQLPFSRLRVHLPEDEGGPLITPALCDGYQAAAELTPWSGDSASRITSAISIGTGPDGGPCPSGGPPPSSGGPGGCADCLPPVAPAPPVVAGQVAPVGETRPGPRRCAKGQRRVRPHGKPRCARRCRTRKRRSRGRARDGKTACARRCAGRKRRAGRTGKARCAKRQAPGRDAARRQPRSHRR